MDLEIRREDAESADARALFAELDELLNSLYAVDGIVLELVPGDVAEEQGVLFVARDDSGRALGCGAIRQIDPTTGELKRMYVRSVARRLGVGQALLDALEHWAAQAGLERIVLETGIHQPAALAFYERAGYSRIDRYGEYPCAEQSVCYGKTAVRFLNPGQFIPE